MSSFLLLLTEKIMKIYWKALLRGVMQSTYQKLNIKTNEHVLKLHITYLQLTLQKLYKS